MLVFGHLIRFLELGHSAYFSAPPFIHARRPIKIVSLIYSLQRFFKWIILQISSTLLFSGSDTDQKSITYIFIAKKIKKVVCPVIFSAPSHIQDMRQFKKYISYIFIAIKNQDDTKFGNFNNI